jgi:hypothetical protein
VSGSVSRIVLQAPDNVVNVVAFFFMIFAAILLVVLMRTCCARTYPEALVTGGVLWLALAQVMAEVLGVFGAFTPRGIILFWLAVAVLLTTYLILHRRDIPVPSMRLSRFEMFGYGSAALLALMAFVTGALVAPNNWDSLTYHLPRAMQWLDQGDLDFFTTGNARQNAISPLADVLIAHLAAGNAEVHWAFFGQWLSGVIVITGVGILANIVFESRRITVLSVVVAATVPMLISQMSTTQADLVAGAPVAAAIVAWRWAERGRTLGPSLLLGTALGVAAAVKLTSALLILPWIAIVLLILFRDGKWRSVFSLIGASFIGVVVIAGPFAVRLLANRETAGGVASGVLNGRLGLDVFAVNALRNIASLLTVPSAQIASQLKTGVVFTSESFGIDPALADATFGSGYEPGFAWSEDHAGAPLHLLLIFLALIILALNWRRFGSRKLLILLTVTATQFCLLAIIFRWQPWINRFTFLILVFASPLIAWLISRWFKPIQLALVVLMLLTSFAWVLSQPLRGLAGTQWLPQGTIFTEAIPRYQSPLEYDRFTQHFMHHPPTASTYRRSLERFDRTDARSITMILGGDTWEYPIWYWQRMSADPLNLKHFDDRIDSGSAVMCIDADCSALSETQVETFETSGPPSPSVEKGSTVQIVLAPQAGP